MWQTKEWLIVGVSSDPHTQSLDFCKPHMEVVLSTHNVWETSLANILLR